MDAVFFDENGEFIIEPPEDYSDPWMADCTIKWYFCTKCFRYFHSPEDLKLHSASCAPKFENIIYREGNCCIAHVNSESSVEEKTICEWLMTVQADEIDAKYDSLAPQKWNTHKYQVFLLLEKSMTVSAVVTQKLKIPDENGQQEDCVLVSEIFTLYSQRRKGHMEKLLSVALKALGANFGTAVFQRQFSENGEACLTRIAKKQGLKSIRTFCPPFIDRIMPFPIP
jgi:hypothetical protein